MVFFELRDIETMLNQTADPIADFIKLVKHHCKKINNDCPTYCSAVQADVVAFASQLT